MIQLFAYTEAVDVSHAFIGYHSEQPSVLIDGSFVQLARLNDWISTVTTCLNQGYKVGYQRQKTFANTFATRLLLAKNQLFGRVQAFVQKREPDDLELPKTLSSAV